MAGSCYAPAVGLRSKLLNVVLADLPSSDSVLTEPSPRWDELLGGRKGPGVWGRYERNYGTTCAVAVDGWLLSVGAPPELINATQADGGTGFVPGEHIIRLNAGAKALGWLRTPVRGQLPDFRPGDIFEINHDGGSGDNTHVGVVLRVTPKGSDTLEVETADGGQGTRDNQSAKRNVRTFKVSTGPHAVTVQSPSGAGWLDRWVAVGGDAPDDDVANADNNPKQEMDSSTAIAIGAGFAAFALLIAGAALYVKPDGGKLNALNDMLNRERAWRTVDDELKSRGY